MKQKNSFNIICLTIGALFLLISCNHKDLCYEVDLSAKVAVFFDWKDGYKAPSSGMSIWLFPNNGDLPVRYEFSTSAGGVIDVLQGRYKVVCINNSSEVLQFRNIENWNTFELFTRKTSQLDPLGVQGNIVEANPEGDSVVLAPDILWSDCISEINIKSKNDTITLYPKNKVYTYSVEIRNVKNLKYVSSVGASLSGLAGSFFPCTEKLSDTRSLHPFLCSSDGVSIIKGTLQSFGESSCSYKLNRLALFMILKDGSKFYQTFDVTSQVHSAHDKNIIKIIIDSLDVPKPIVNGSGFQPSVDEWGVITENIIM